MSSLKYGPVILFKREPLSAHQRHQHTHNLSFHPLCSCITFADALAKRDITCLSSVLCLRLAKRWGTDYCAAKPCYWALCPGKAPCLVKSVQVPGAGYWEITLVILALIAIYPYHLDCHIPVSPGLQPAQRQNWGMAKKKRDGFLLRHEDGRTEGWSH